MGKPTHVQTPRRSVLKRVLVTNGTSAMKLHFLGATGQVTGSRYCLEAGGGKYLIDCGMFQERPYLDRNWEPSPIAPREIEAVVLTHVHVDHCGLLPRLVREGFRGPVYCTRPSAELAEIILRDSARIQTEDVRFKKKRHEKEGRRGTHPEIALFTDADVDKTMPLFQGVPYGKTISLDPRVSLAFHEAGHILGSAMLEFQVRETDRPARVVFSGDIGQWNKPLIRDPTLFEQADYVVMESTYGDRDHPDSGDIESQLEQAINETLSRGGNVVIPVFAVERAQELVYYLSRLAHAGRIPQVEAFLDSPMAVDVAEIFRNHRECFDQETWNLIIADESPLRFPGLRMVRGVNESQAINDRRGSCIIMATSGMCTAGRIKHHLRHNIGRAGLDGPVRRLPGPWNPGPPDSGRTTACAHPWPRLEGEGACSADRRVLGACRPLGIAPLDRAPEAGSPPGVPHPRRSGGCEPAGGADPGAVSLAHDAPQIPPNGRTGLRFGVLSDAPSVSYHKKRRERTPETVRVGNLPGGREPGQRERPTRGDRTSRHQGIPGRREQIACHGEIESQE